MENKAISMIELGKVYTFKIFSGEEIGEAGFGMELVSEQT